MKTQDQFPHIILLCFIHRQIQLELNTWKESHSIIWLSPFRQHTNDVLFMKFDIMKKSFQSLKKKKLQRKITDLLGWVREGVPEALSPGMNEASQPMMAKWEPHSGRLATESAFLNPLAEVD